jgi:Spy/CpxP family protein refolding chaperone
MVTKISPAKAQSAAACQGFSLRLCNRPASTGVFVFGKLPWNHKVHLGVNTIKMNKLGRFKTLAIATLSAIALATSIAVAQSVTTDQGDAQGTRTERRGGRGKHKGHGWGGMRQGGFFRQLNLTEDQQAKMKQIRESFAERNKPLREQLRAKRQELRQANEGGTFNEALATQKLTEMAGLQARLMGERSKLHQEMLSVLTAEQKAQLEQSKAQFKTRRGERRNRDNNQ